MAVMDLETFLNSFSDLLVVIKDEKARIVYPEEPQIIQYIKELKYYTKGEFFHPELEEWYKCTVTDVIYNGKKYAIYKYVNITEYKKQEQEYKLDETTGIMLKKTTFHEVEKYLTQAYRTGESFATIMTDADFFRKVNETYGHIAGDYVLNTIAQTFASNIRQTNINNKKYADRPADIVGRVGGEEFLIVLKNIPATVALSRIDSIRRKICETPIVFNGDEINISCSFGVVHFLPNTFSRFDLLNRSMNTVRSAIMREADEQLYEAKNDGRNNVKMTIGRTL